MSKEGSEIPRGPEGGMYDAKFERHISSLLLFGLNGTICAAKILSFDRRYRQLTMSSKIAFASLAYDFRFLGSVIKK